MIRLFIFYVLIAMSFIGCAPPLIVDYKPDRIIAELDRDIKKARKGTSHSSTDVNQEISLGTNDYVASKYSTQNINIVDSYHALVIGINNYLHLQDLRTAKYDARAVASILNEDYGFSVNLMIDPARSEIISVLGKFRRKLTSEDNLLIYYAGHGWLDEDADEGYWLAADAIEDDESNWISNSTITSSIRAMRAKHVMVVADSCYSGKLVRGIHIRRKTPDYLSRISQKVARVVLTSGGLEPVVDCAGNERHSVFTSAFTRALRENHKVMDGTELFSKIRRLVMLNSDQTPEYADIRKAGHDGGDFLFVRPAGRANNGRGVEQ